MLPGLDPVREQMTGSPDPLDPDAFTAYLSSRSTSSSGTADFVSIVLHLPLLDWLGEHNLASILEALTTTASWVAPCDEVAAHILSHPAAFKRGATLDPTTWAPERQPRSLPVRLSHCIGGKGALERASSR